MLSNFLQLFYNRINSPYKDLGLRIIVALFASHLIVSHGNGFFDVVLLPGYLFSLAASFIIAFFLFALVNFITVKLDGKLPWETSFKKRVIFQFSIGVLLIVGVAYILAYYLFNYNEQNISESDYMKYDFYFVCLYIAIMNVYYYVFDRFDKKRMIGSELTHYKNYHRNYSFRNAPPKLQDIDLAAFNMHAKTIACICWINKKLYVYQMDTTYIFSVDTIENTFASLPKEDYLTVNRYCVVHRLLVYSWKEASSRRLTLSLRIPFNNIVPKERKEVSQLNKDSFIANFES